MRTVLCVISFLGNDRAHKALEKIDGDVTLEAFHQLSDTYAGMLTAVHPMQERLRRRVLGIKTWERLEHVRVSLSGGRQYAPMDQVLVLGTDAVVFPIDNTATRQSCSRWVTGHLPILRCLLRQHDNTSTPLLVCY
jgi:hypothetical protein